MIFQPSNDDDYYHIWLRVDRMVRSWIINTISKEIVGSSMYAKSAKVLWDDLRHRFGESAAPTGV
ncbi:hypothetical protein J0J30_24405, partial [Vibrio vulnificus]|nr:hypothetical protein [Vibrio vulnificus]